jgi:hypothetical protein
MIIFLLKQGIVFPLSSDALLESAYTHTFLYEGYWVLTTGEFREPKKGDWFISGAIPEGYQAMNDLPQKYDIA